MTIKGQSPMPMDFCREAESKDFSPSEQIGKILLQDAQDGCFPGGNIESIYRGGSEKGTESNYESSKPLTGRDLNDALKEVRNRVSKLIPEQDRNRIESLNLSLLIGDEKGFASQLKRIGNDPERVKNTVEELNKALEYKQCTTQLSVTSDGKVVVSGATRNQAIVFDPATGQSVPRRVEHNFDGSTNLVPGELLKVDQHKIFSELGEQVVRDIKNTKDADFLKLATKYMQIGDPIIVHKHKAWVGSSISDGPSIFEELLKERERQDSKTNSR